MAVSCNEVIIGFVPLICTPTSGISVILREKQEFQMVFTILTEIANIWKEYFTRTDRFGKLKEEPSWKSCNSTTWPRCRGELP